MLGIKYTDYSGSTQYTEIDSFMFDGDTQITQVPQHLIDDERKLSIKCRCGSNDWTDNGRDMNEYECNGCGQFISAYERRPKYESKEVVNRWSEDHE